MTPKPPKRRRVRKGKAVASKRPRSLAEAGTDSSGRLLTSNQADASSNLAGDSKSYVRTESSREDILATAQSLFKDKLSLSAELKDVKQCASNYHLATMQIEANLRRELQTSQALHLTATQRNAELTNELKNANTDLESYVKSFDEYKRETNKAIAEWKGRCLHETETIKDLQRQLGEARKPRWKRSLHEIFA